MALSKVRIGSFIQEYKEKCNVPNLTIWDVSGINRDKEFFEPSVQVGSNTSNYKVVPPNYFACNLMHVGRDVVLPISMNETDKNKIVSPAYTVFSIKNEKFVLKDFFFIMLKSSEKDRFFWFHTDSSVRDGMSFDVFCDTEIEVPPIEIQRKYVAIYKALKHNLKVYQSNLDDLKLVCDAYIENLRKKLHCEEIGKYIEELNERNSQGYQILGISKDGFIIPKQNTGEIENYKVFSYNNFVYSPPRINVGSIGLYKGKSPKACSPIYVCFKIKDEKKLNPEYLLMWLNRKEFFRSTDFFSIGSVRNNFSFDIMSEVKIPIPKIETQEAIANVFKTYFKRQAILLNLKDLINNICPVLIRGAIKEANGTK